MRKHLSILRLSTLFCILIAATLLTNISFAQEEAPQFYRFGYAQVKPGMTLEFEEFVKGSLPVIRAAGVTEMDVWKTSNYGVSDKYVFIMPEPTPAQLDTELANPQTAVPAGMVPVMSAMNRMLVGTQDVMITPRSEITVPTAENYEMKLALFVAIGTAPGRAADFEAGVKQVMSIWSEAGAKGVYVNKVGLGGNLDEYNVWVFFDSFADMTAGLSKFEQNMAKTQIKLPTDLVYYRNSEIFVRCPDLCIQPEAQ